MMSLHLKETLQTNVFSFSYCQAQRVASSIILLSLHVHHHRNKNWLWIVYRLSVVQFFSYEKYFWFKAE